MTESRQQRRARERAEAKAATRPGPVPHHASQPAPHLAEGATRKTAVLDVELSRVEFAPDDVSWGAEWGLRNSSTGTEDSHEDLHELVGLVLEDVAKQFATKYELRIEWSITGDRPADRSLEEEVAATGVTLPPRLSAARSEAVE